MSEAAKVLDLDELARFRAAVIKALDELRLAVDEADSDIGRLRVWIERDQVRYWTGQTRKAQELVALCKSALYRKQMVTSSKDQKPSVVDEKKALERAKARLDLCERKMALTKRWAIQISREEILFKAGMAPLTSFVERDLPHAVTLLARMLQHLEAYMRVEAPDLVSLLGDRQSQEMISEMRRQGTTRTADAMAEAVAEEDAATDEGEVPEPFDAASEAPDQCDSGSSPPAPSPGRPRSPSDSENSP